MPPPRYDLPVADLKQLAVRLVKTAAEGRPTVQARVPAQ
jgi:hypothetical protein